MIKTQIQPSLENFGTDTAPNTVSFGLPKKRSIQKQEVHRQAQRIPISRNHKGAYLNLNDDFLTNSSSNVTVLQNTSNPVKHGEPLSEEFDKLQNKYPRITKNFADMLSEINWISGMSVRILSKMIWEASRYGLLQGIVPERDERGKIIFFYVRFGAGDLQQWRIIDNELSRVAHDLYLNYGERVIELRKLIQTDCLGV